MATKKKKTPRERRSYTDEYRAAAAQRVIDGESIGRVAADLDMVDGLLRGWVHKLKAGKLVAAAADAAPTKPAPGSIAAGGRMGPTPLRTAAVTSVQLPPSYVNDVPALREQLATARAEIKRLRRVIDTLLGD